MNSFLKFYDDKYYERGWELNIHHSSISDWCIEVGYKITNNKHGEKIVSVQDCDLELAFAKAQVQLKEWLIKNEDGY